MKEITKFIGEKLNEVRVRGKRRGERMMEYEIILRDRYGNRQLVGTFDNNFIKLIKSWTQSKDDEVKG